MDEDDYDDEVDDFFHFCLINLMLKKEKRMKRMILNRIFDFVISGNFHCLYNEAKAIG